MVAYIRVPFATSGDRTAIPVTGSAAGPINYTYGYGVDYSLPRDTDPAALTIERLGFNELMYDITSNIQQYQQHGVPEFITTSDNGGTAFPYTKNAIVRWDNGSSIENYISLVGSNITLPSNTTNWAKLSGNTALLDAANTFTGVNTFSNAAGTFGSSTAAAAYGLGSGATINGATKTINIGTAGVSGSTTNINLGSAVSGALGTLAINAAILSVLAFTTAGVLTNNSSGVISSNSSLVLTTPASSVNYSILSGAAAAASPSLAMAGTDTNIGFTITPKGTGVLATTSLNLTGSTIPANGLYLAAANTLGLSARSLSALQITNPASAVNYWAFQGGATGSPGICTMQVTGTDTNIGANLLTKGTGPLTLYSHAGTVVMAQFTAVASGVNYLQFAPAVASGSPAISAVGSDTDINLFIASKGVGDTYLLAGSATVAKFSTSATPVNFLNVSASATGNPVVLSCTGTDTNVTAQFRTKGTGGYSFLSHAGAVNVMALNTVASAVNYYALSNNTAGNAPLMQVIGTDTDIPIAITSKGGGPINFYSHATAAQQFAVSATTSAVNWLYVAGNVAGTGPFLATTGNDTNVPMNLATKGTGGYNFTTSGSNTLRLAIDGVGGNVYVGSAALATTATAGFIWFTSSAGPPTGAATAPYTGACALHYDSTNNKLYVRSGGTWRSTAALT